MRVRYLIIGGGVAGTTAAETIRRHDGEGSIAIVSDEPYRLYSRIALSKENFFLEKIPFDRIWLKDEAWYAARRIDLLSGKQAVRFDAAAKKITCGDGTEIVYEKLLLAPGGAAQKLDLPGADKQGVFYLRSLDDAQYSIAAAKQAQHALVIGGGFVGFEMCDMLRLAGVAVTLVIREPYFWREFLDEPSGRMVEEAIEHGGVRIVRNAEVAAITGGAAADGVMLSNGTRIPADMIVVGIGMSFPFSWLQNAGVAVRRGILANEYLETNIQGVWAAGDAAEFNDVVLGEQVQLGNWVNAQQQGMIAGMNMTGTREQFRLVSFYTTRGFGVAIVFIGDARMLHGRQVVTRGSPEERSCARIVCADGKVLGATLVNRTHEMGEIVHMIKSGIVYHEFS